ncbi:hypothetical protein SAMN05444266_102300 [Chitinophaga jiangningensis]|uniref:Uncharacterized protein n=1 Tax=Chitinophaga jiangningensis TaxID=1419482 RepID=A0A1M6YFY5_9BACT|nr:hypothetical protein [Chitinophaga jiangningensis]SHL17177.1 hypothetical protein SAMN05444266_102300 [Chitinophaga jiangningensis]
MKHLLFVLTLLACTCCQAQTAQRAMIPGDTLLNRISAVVNALTGDRWDSASIISSLSASDRYLIAIDSTSDPLALVIKSEVPDVGAFRLQIRIPDSLAKQIPLDSIKARFGEPVPDILGNELVIQKEPILAYRIRQVNVVFNSVYGRDGEEKVVYDVYIYR